MPNRSATTLPSESERAALDVRKAVLEYDQAFSLSAGADAAVSALMGN